jgi:hypothetical protein
LPLVRNTALRKTRFDNCTERRVRERGDARRVRVPALAQMSGGGISGQKYVQQFSYYMQGDIYVANNCLVVLKHSILIMIEVYAAAVVACGRFPSATAT